MEDNIKNIQGKKFDVSALIKKVIYGKIKENVLNK